jgi:hypothetical protein
MGTFIFVSICLIFKLIVKDYNKPVVSEVDQIINAITEKKPIKYISNGIELKTNFREHYFKILDMEKGRLYDREMITEQIVKQHSFYEEDMKVGYKTKYNTNDINLAEDYILNNYDYITTLN